MKPGTDIALMMSMIQVIIAEKIYNREFMLAHTCAPFLVRMDNGNYLRMSDFGVAPNKRTDQPHDRPAHDYQSKHGLGPGNPFSNSRRQDCEPPLWRAPSQLRGSRSERPSIYCRSVWRRLPPERGRGNNRCEAGCHPGSGKRICHDPARREHILGYGGNAYDNGPIWGHAVATLHAITGQIGRPGSFVALDWFAFLGVNFSLAAPEAVPTLLVPELLKTGKFKGKPRPPIKALWVSHANPVTAFAEQNFWVKEFWPTLDFVVVADEQLTDTARLADIVLPTAHWYEREDILPMGGSHPFIQHTDKAIEPLYEAKADVDIHRLLAKKMGVGQELRRIQ